MILPPSQISNRTRSGWGKEKRKALRFAFYICGHWLRMPPSMLAHHLWTKATR